MTSNQHGSYTLGHTHATMGSTKGRQAVRRNSQETASDKLEEGGDDVKSSWPLCPGLHTCYNGRYNAKPTREGELIAKNRS